MCIAAAHDTLFMYQLHTCGNVYQPLQGFGRASIIDPRWKEVILIIVLGTDTRQRLELAGIQAAIHLPYAFWAVANFGLWWQR